MGRVLVTATSLVLIVSACTFGNAPEPSPSPTGPKTIRIGLMSGDEDRLQGACSFRVCGRTFDPALPWMGTIELDRCCFMRTLMSYELATPDSSTTLAPDLAASAPSISSDGLLWTFHLRKGLHYAPPMAETEIVAADIIRSIERARTPSGPAIPWNRDRTGALSGTIGGYLVDTYVANVVAGAEDFTAGRTSHISGLQAPDPYTLQVHLTHPAGDLGNQLAVTGLGPIPANPAHPDDPLGVAQGHDFDYGDVIVSSGPYMFEGSEHLDLSPPPMDQIPASGNGSAVMTLVRNPSWSAATDPLRRAWADRLEFYRVPNGRTAERLVRTGALDVVLDWSTDFDTVARWRADPTLRDRMLAKPLDIAYYVSINVAVPPFDDLHVRRAMNMVVDRDRLVRVLQHEGTSAEPTLHIGLDSYEDNLLIGYDPFGVGTSGDVDAARREMGRSRYDADADGRCDAAVCRSIPLLVGNVPESVSAGRAIAAQLEQIGLDVAVRPRDQVPFGDPSAHTVLRWIGWIKDFPDAATFFPLLFASDSAINDVFIGANAATLRRFGYHVASVPSVDSQIEQCTTALFQAQVRCWAQLDTYMSEHVVPWVPVAVAQNGWAVSERLRNFTIDSSAPHPMPAPDSLEVGSAAIAPAPVPPSPTSVPNIPPGLYRTRVSPEDINRYGAHVSGEDLRGTTGTYTILVRDGQFTQHQTAPFYPVWNPIQLGTYQGEGDRVRFDVQAPFPDGVSADLRWSVEGTDLRFTVDRCVGFVAKHANICALVSAFYEARPWQLVTAL
jgi:peptide/nickel transport system substrate-binding protein